MSKHLDESILQPCVRSRGRSAKLYARALSYAFIRTRFRETMAHKFKLENRTFVFVCGLHRSGTSILLKNLRSNPNVEKFYKTGRPEDEGQHLQQVLPNDDGAGGVDSIALHPLGHTTEESPYYTEPNRQQLLVEWGRWLNFDKPVVVEKSPPTMLRTRFFQKWFPNSHFIFIVRHPVPTMLATMKWAVGKSVARMIQHWLAAHHITLKDSENLKSVKICRYENMLHYPGKFLNETTTSPGIQNCNVSPLWKKHNTKYFGFWKSRALLSDEKLASLEDENHDILDRFGLLAAAIIDPPSLPCGTDAGNTPKNNGRNNDLHYA